MTVLLIKVSSVKIYLFFAKINRMWKLNCKHEREIWGCDNKPVVIKVKYAICNYHWIHWNESRIWLLNKYFATLVIHIMLLYILDGVARNWKLHQFLENLFILIFRNYLAALHLWGPFISIFSLFFYRLSFATMISIECVSFSFIFIMPVSTVCTFINHKSQ